MRNRYFFICCITIILCFSSIRLQAQPGTLDPTFNPTDIGLGFGDGANENVGVIKVQPDGKIIIGGHFTSYNGIPRSYIARLNADGTIDNSFNSGTGANSDVNTISILSDGKIIIGGIFTTYNGTTANHIARLNNDGSLDASFNIGTGANNSVYSSVLQSDGKIIIAGSFTAYNGSSRSRIARLNSDGTIDPTFNPAGINNIIRTVVLQNDEKIIVGGDFTTIGLTGRNYVARLNMNGALDTTFNPGTGPNSIIHSSNILIDGKIIIAGNFTAYNGAVRNRIARIHPDGTLDTAFYSETASYVTTLYSSTVQPDGKIIVGGWFPSYNGSIVKHITRLFSTGRRDTTFVQGASASDLICSSAVLSDGKILFGGQFLSYNNIIRVRMGRLNYDGSLDETFNPGYGANMQILTSSVLYNDKIIIGGSFTSFNGITRNGIAGLNSDGTPDPAFNPGSGAGTVYTTCLQNDGNVMLGGWFNSYNGTARKNIARIHSDGSLDTSFNPGTGASSFVLTTSAQNDGKIIIGGIFTTYNGTTANHIARLNNDGSLDASFIMGTGASSTVYSSAIQSDGKIILGGLFNTYNGTTSRCIARINSSGTIDTAFHPGSGANMIVYALAIQNDGKILIGGGFTTYNGITQNYIARLLPDGTIDTSFHTGTGANNTVRSITLQPDRKIIIAGEFTFFDGTSCNYIARLNEDGSRDVSFLPLNAANYAITTTKLQSNGKIIAAGHFTSYDGVGRNRIARLSNCINSLTSVNASACDNYTWFGNTYSTSGNYTHTLSNAAGCDSIITLHLIINNNSSDTIVNTCDSFFWHGNMYASSCTATDVLTNQLGCDSTITLHLSIGADNTYFMTETACDNYTAPDGNVYNTSGIKTAVIPNASGCDSTITINLTINNTSVSNVFETVCNKFYFNGAYIFSSGIYSDTLSSIHGCDSIIFLSLTIHSEYLLSEAHSICNGQTYTWHGQNLTASGVYYDNQTSINGCDSTYTLSLSVNPDYEYFESHSICNGQTYTWHGQSLTAAGTYYDNYTSFNGCDSIYTLTLLVNPVFAYSVNDTICAGDTLNWQGADYSTAGEFNNLYSSVFGCDSTYTLHLYLRTLPVVSFSGFNSLYCVYDPSVILTGSPSGGTFSGTGISGSTFDPNVAGAGTYDIIYSYTDGYLCTNSDTNTIVVDMCNGIYETNEHLIPVYPNPATNEIIIQIPQLHSYPEVCIINSLGEEVVKLKIFKIESPVKIDIAKLRAGIYVVKIGIYSGKFVKVN